jgi:ligand-binding sensor domain-containing protein
LSPTGLIATEGLSKTLATTGGIKIVKPGSAVQIFYPDGPLANLVYSMNADGYGNLWIATGKDGFGKGLFKYDRKSWSYYSMGNAPFPTNDYVNVSPGSDGSIYAGTWGFGLTKITAQGVFTTYNADNSPLLGIPSNPNFVVIGGSSTDSKNNLWVLNYHSADRTTLLVNTAANKWYGFTNPVDNSLTMYYNMVIDGNDTKWFVCTDAQRSGLFYFNENKTFTTTADDYYGYASGSGELAGKSINALAVDKRGELWVGTNLGVYVLNDPGTVLSSSPSARFNLIFSLRQYTVTGIVVDAINRKWIATNQGLLLVSPDGTTLLNYFTTKNSPLLSEQIRGLAFDHINGILYVGTDLGMISAATLALQPKNDLSELQVYPSPVLLDKSAMVTIEGLVKDSEVKVLTLSGKLVKHIITPGGRRALWDCRNEKNEVIASGIYLVVAYDKDGNIIASTKMAAIRK